MLDLKAIRDDPEPARRALARRGAAEDLDRALELDAEWRALTAEVEELRAEQNRGSKAIGKSPPEERAVLLESLKAVSDSLKAKAPRLDSAEAELRELLLRLPNLPDETSPDGFTDEDAREVRTWGEPPDLGFEPRDHVDIGIPLGLFDLERAAKVSGSRFAYLRAAAPYLQFALVRLAFDTLEARGFVPVIPPVMVREEAMLGTGFLPTDEAQIYVTREDDLYLVGTAEVPLAGMHQGEILELDALPVRYAGYSTCFRREAGTYGKDTRGIFRVHQFDKVEMFSFVEPSIEKSRAEHEFLLDCEETLVRALELPYRVVDIAAGDLGASAAKKYDLEVWLPGQGRYRELTSCSNCTDYQARRLECRVRTAEGNRPVHTLNGTAFAIGRTLIAILENHQRRDGSVEIPEALRPHLPDRLHRLVPA